MDDTPTQRGVFAHTEIPAPPARLLIAALDQSADGQAVFGPDERLIFANARFCRDFRSQDEPFAPGRSFASLLDDIAVSGHLQLPPEDSPTRWHARNLRSFRAGRASITLSLSGNRWLQFRIRRIEDGAFHVVEQEITGQMRPAGPTDDTGLDAVLGALDAARHGLMMFDARDQLVRASAGCSQLLGQPRYVGPVGRPLALILNDLAGDFVFPDARDRDDLRGWVGSRRGRLSVDAQVEDARWVRLLLINRPEGGSLLHCSDVSMDRELIATLAKLNAQLEDRLLDQSSELEEAQLARARAEAVSIGIARAAGTTLRDAVARVSAHLGDFAVPPAQADVLAQCRDELTHVSKDLRAVSTLSELEADHRVIERRLISLADLMPTLQGAGAPGVRLRTPDLTVRSDPTLLRYALELGLANARVHAPGAQVLISARRRGAEARIEIRDQGPGMTEAAQARAFHAFWRGSGDGLGVGLAVVNRIGMRLGHPVSLWSRAGQGTCLSLTVPLADPGPSRAVAPARPSPGIADLGLILLVVAGEPRERLALVTQLADWGVHVVDADSGMEALQILKDFGLRPDGVIVQEPFGPAAPGVELCRRLRRTLGPVPCSILMRSPNSEAARVCDLSGVDLIALPWSGSDLTHFLQKVEQAAEP